MTEQEIFAALAAGKPVDLWGGSTAPASNTQPIVQTGISQQAYDQIKASGTDDAAVRQKEIEAYRAQQAEQALQEANQPKAYSIGNYDGPGSGGWDPGIQTIQKAIKEGQAKLVTVYPESYVNGGYWDYRYLNKPRGKVLSEEGDFVDPPGQKMLVMNGKVYPTSNNWTISEVPSNPGMYLIRSRTSGGSNVFNNAYVGADPATGNFTGFSPQIFQNGSDSRWSSFGPIGGFVGEALGGIFSDLRSMAKETAGVWMPALNFVAPGVGAVVNTLMAASNGDYKKALISATGIPGVSGFVDPQLADLVKTSGQAVQLTDALKRGDTTGAIMVATNILKAGETKLNDKNLTVSDVLKTAKLVEAIDSGNPNAIFSAVTSIAKTAGKGDTSTITGVQKTLDSLKANEPTIKTEADLSNAVTQLAGTAADDGTTEDIQKAIDILKPGVAVAEAGQDTLTGGEENKTVDDLVKEVTTPVDKADTVTGGEDTTKGGQDGFGIDTPFGSIFGPSEFLFTPEQLFGPGRDLEAPSPDVINPFEVGPVLPGQSLNGELTQDQLIQILNDYRATHAAEQDTTGGGQDTSAGGAADDGTTEGIQEVIDNRPRFDSAGNLIAYTSGPQLSRGSDGSYIVGNDWGNRFYDDESSPTGYRSVNGTIVNEDGSAWTDPNAITGGGQDTAGGGQDTAGGGQDTAGGGQDTAGGQDTLEGGVGPQDPGFVFDPKNVLFEPDQLLNIPQDTQPAYTAGPINPWEVGPVRPGESLDTGMTEEELLQLLYPNGQDTQAGGEETAVDDGTTDGIQDVIDQTTVPGGQDTLTGGEGTAVDDGTTGGIQDVIDRDMVAGGTETEVDKTCAEGFHWDETLQMCIADSDEPAKTTECEPGYVYNVVTQQCEKITDTGTQPPTQQPPTQQPPTQQPPRQTGQQPALTPTSNQGLDLNSLLALLGAAQQPQQPALPPTVDIGEQLDLAGALETSPFAKKQTHSKMATGGSIDDLLALLQQRG